MRSTAVVSVGKGRGGLGSIGPWGYLIITGYNIVGLESTAILIGHISHEVKFAGKPGRGEPYAGFDEAGAGNGLWGTAPILDPTGEGLRETGG